MTIKEIELKERELDLKERELNIREKELDNNLKIAIINSFNIPLTENMYFDNKLYNEPLFSIAYNHVNNS